MLSHKAVVICKSTQWPEIDKYVACGKTLADNLNVFGIASVQITMLQLALHPCREKIACRDGNRCNKWVGLNA